MSQIKPEKDNNKEYKVEVICNYKVYAKELDNDHLLRLYYLNFMKRLHKTKKYLGANISFSIPLKTCYHFSQRVFGKVNDDFCIYQFHFTNSHILNQIRDFKY